MTDNTDNDVKLGYIGLGNMGAPMAKRLVDWPGGVTVFDVRTEAMTQLAEAGAMLADSVADVVAAFFTRHVEAKAPRSHHQPRPMDSDFGKREGRSVPGFPHVPT